MIQNKFFSFVQDVLIPLPVPPLVLSLSGMLLGMATCVNPVAALEVEISPTQPQLGDTLSVVVYTDKPGVSPTIIFQGKTHPTFPLSQGRWRALLPTTPLDSPGNWPLQVKADETKNLSIKVADRYFYTQSIWLPPGKDNIQGTDEEFDRIEAFRALVTPQKFWSGPFLRPNNGEITTVYGVRRYYNGEFAKDYYHRGVDYAGAYGSPVVAPAAGKVMLVGREADGFAINGNTVGIDHGQGVTSVLIHLSRINVREGDFVQPGQVIGAVGNSGASTGPHLHWGLYVHGKSVDPVPWRYNSFD